MLHPLSLPIEIMAHFFHKSDEALARCVEWLLSAYPANFFGWQGRPLIINNVKCDGPKRCKNKKCDRQTVQNLIFELLCTTDNQWKPHNLCQHMSITMSVTPSWYFSLTYNIRHSSLEIRFQKCDRLFADWLNFNFKFKAGWVIIATNWLTGPDRPAGPSRPPCLLLEVPWIKCISHHAMLTPLAISTWIFLFIGQAASPSHPVLSDFWCVLYCSKVVQPSSNVSNIADKLRGYQL